MKSWWWTVPSDPIDAIIERWARRQVIEHYEREAKFHALHPEVYLDDVTVPTLDDIIEVRHEIDEGRGSEQIGDCTWDMGEPTTIEIAYKLRKDADTLTWHRIYVDIELVNITRGLIAAAAELSNA